MTIQLQPSTPEDESWLEELRRAAYSDLFIATWGGWDEARHQRHWTSCVEEGRISIIRQDGTSVGMVQIFDEGNSVEVAEIQILPEFQDRGIGTHVLRDILKMAHSSRKSVTLSTGRMNARAIRLYQRLGFELVEETDAKSYFKLHPLV